MAIGGFGGTLGVVVATVVPPGVGCGGLMTVGSSNPPGTSTMLGAMPEPRASFGGTGVFEESASLVLDD